MIQTSTLEREKLMNDDTIKQETYQYESRSTMQEVPEEVNSGMMNRYESVQYAAG